MTLMSSNRIRDALTLAGMAVDDFKPMLGNPDEYDKCVTYPRGSLLGTTLPLLTLCEIYRVELA